MTKDTDGVIVLKHDEIEAALNAAKLGISEGIFKYDAAKGTVEFVKDMKSADIDAETDAAVQALEDTQYYIDFNGTAIVVVRDDGSALDVAP